MTKEKLKELLEEMRQLFEEAVLKQSIKKKWHWLYLWMFPTYVYFGEGQVIFFKRVKGHMFIVGMATAPWMEGK